VQTGNEAGYAGNRISGLDPGADESNRVGLRIVTQARKGESKVEKAKKAEVVEDLGKVFAKAGSVVVAHYSGLTVAQMSELRARMREQGASFRVAKNRLAVRALKGTPIEGIAHLFKGPTGIAVSEDPVSAAKVTAAYAKDNDKLVILGGSVGETALDAQGVQALATLPSLDALRGKIVGLILAPATKIAGVVQAPAGQLARVIGAYAKKEAA
jgi:large subunit ribosomal protein L10